jgi:hypothetical protein
VIFLGTEGDPGAAKRTQQDRAPAVVGSRLERHWTLGRDGVADGHAAGAERSEVERPAMLAREAAHVRDGSVDQVIDEAHAAGQREHLVGKPVSRDTREA